MLLEQFAGAVLRQPRIGADEPDQLLDVGRQFVVRLIAHHDANSPLRTLPAQTLIANGESPAQSDRPPAPVPAPSSASRARARNGANAPALPGKSACGPARSLPCGWAGRSRSSAGTAPRTADPDRM